MADVLAATLLAPGQLQLQRFPYPDDLEPGAVLLKMLASGICGTDKHTFRGETQQYAGTDHASSTPFPIIQGHENVGIVTAIGDGGATAFDGSLLHVGDRVVPAPNRACGKCEFCRGDFPYYFCRRLENYGNSLTCSESPHLFGGWAEYLYLRPRTPVFKVPDNLPTGVAVLTELFAVTHSLDLAAKMPRPGGFREGDTVAVVGIGPVGVVHVVVLPSREVWCPAWVLARCSGRQLLFRLTAVVGPSGTGMTWSWSQRWAGVVQIGVVQVPSRKSMALPSLRDGNRPSSVTSSRLPLSSVSSR